MSYQLELRHLRYFLAVAEELHFRKAAERLYISQPGLSKQIKDMEKGLGIQLFRRSNRKVALTAAGTFLQREFGTQVSLLEKSIHHAKMINDGKQGSLSFGYVGSAMQQVLPSLLLAYRNRHDAVLFNLTEMDNESQIDSLLHQRIDFGFVRLDRVPRGLIAHPILSEHFCLILPGDHEISTSSFHSLNQFRNESFILFDPAYSPSYYEQVMQIFDEVGFSPIVSHSTINAATIQQLVQNRFGISIIPNSLKMENANSIQYIDLDHLPQRTVLSAVWNPANSNPVMQGFVHEILREDDTI